MPTMTVIHAGKRSTGRFGRRVTIGRWPTNGIVLDGADVSRVHAWVGQDEQGWFIADAGSRSGTFVNGQRVSDPIRLRNKDMIQVGPATLRYDQTDTEAAEFADVREPRHIAREGVFFTCKCGAPLWSPPGLDGAAGRCRHCGKVVKIPRGTGVPPVAGDRLEASPTLCGICQWPLRDGMDLHRCPTCGLSFHEECWHENGGCSAYGCSGDQAPVAPVDEELITADIDAASPSVPREHLLLLGSLAGALAAMATFGAPALLALIAGLIRLRRRDPSSPRGVLYLSLVIAFLGLTLGVPASYFFWFGRG